MIDEKGEKPLTTRRSSRTFLANSLASEIFTLEKVTNSLNTEVS